ncbi:uncharacterized protein BYT42DRAFT_613094 [Radiomyces spectabilis]|uniref:uncharacterized protein n=1 Tax=Radiomyces spectabilis TaxID=64574 RepID=UPI00221F44EE|nr:uncharacterized protein BYT42DRAFT_613094 [Radiomyces spectabilis]KAI8381304.1 hypothetical protein BYT42DRAFT_613094 [Radiomyces spectabilis]
MHEKHRHHRIDEEDDDDEFDWNEDPDQPRPRRRKTARQKFHEVMQRPCCWHFLSPFMKRFIIAVTGSIVFLGIAISSYVFLPPPTSGEREQPEFKNVRSNVECWMLWAAFMWHIGWLTTMVVELVPSAVSLWTKVCKGRRSEHVKTRLEYYMSLKRYLTILLIAAWNWGSWAFLLDVPFPSVTQQPYSLVICNIFSCLFFTACFLFVQKLIIQIIATRFHRSAYEDRIRESKYALKILDSLSQSEVRRTRPDSRVPLRPFRSAAATRGTTPPDVVSLADDPPGASADGNINNDSARLPRHNSTTDIFSQLQKRFQHIVLTDQPNVHGKIEKAKVDVNSTMFAKKVAKKLFYSLAYPHGVPYGGEDPKRCLDVHDFRPYFSSDEEAEKAFAVFDNDGNGNLTRREFRDTVLHIYKERKALAQSLRDTGQALGKIDAMLLLISIIANIFICLAIFQVDVWHSLVPLGSCLLALTFVFGNTAKNTFESILFVFVTHPYDAGDYVLIDGQYLLVHNLGLMGTVFIRADGQMVYAPTTVLMTKLITNVRRSGDMGETITLTIDFRTPTEQLYILKERITDWVNCQSRDFAPGFDLRVADIVDVNQLILTLWLPHKGNWQEIGKRHQRKTRFMIALKDIMTQLGIRYELPAQRFTTTSSSHVALPFGEKQQAAVEPKPQSFAL